MKFVRTRIRGHLICRPAHGLSCLWFCVCLLSPVLFADEMSVPDYTLVDRLFEEGDYDGALLLLDDEYAESSETLFRRARIELAQDNLDAAKETFRAGLALDADHRHARFELAEVMYKQLRYEAAAEEYEQCLSSGPREPMIVYKLLLCRLLLGDEERVDALLASTAFTLEDPLYYFSHAAKALADHESSQAMYFIQSAKQLFGRDDNMRFLAPLVAQSWLTEGEMQ